MILWNRLKIQYHHLSVFLIYFSLSVFLTWPLAFNLESVILGGPGDASGGAWGIWSGFIATHKTELLSAPFGITLAQASVQPLYDLLSVFSGMAFGAVKGYNLFALLSYPLTAVALFFFIEHALKNRLAAFVGGMIFGFCPAVVVHGSGGHIGFSFNLLIPLFLLSLFNNRLKRTVFSAAFGGAVLALISFISLYIGYFCMVIAVFFAVFDWVASQKRLGGQAL